MQEFTSISVSSYDAASLADKLSEKSAAGWDIVAIVPAGTNITAYLSREAAAEPAEPAPAWDAGAEATPADGGETGVIGGADAAPSSGTTQVAEHQVTEPETEQPAETAAAVEEPAGWALAPEPANPPSSGSGAEAEIGASVGEPQLGSTTAGYESTAAATPGYDTGTSSGATTEPTAADEPAAAEPEPVAEPEPEREGSAAGSATTATASAAPAGWYADPSGRYELRYWDGNQWTEHVSRGGQQYTDPPVA